MALTAPGIDCGRQPGFKGSSQHLPGGLHLITSIRRNMRNHLMPLADKVMLRKRFLIETVLDTLKS